MIHRTPGELLVNNPPVMAISSTLGWNPGDEIIRMGIENLLRRAGGEFVSLLADRSPWAQNAHLGESGGYKDLNSLHYAGKIPEVDWWVFGGSPEWYGRALLGFRDRALSGNSLYLGIGSPHLQKRLRRSDIRSLQSARLIVCRDQNAADIVERGSGVEPVVLPCPALFSCEDPREVVESPRVIGFCWQVPGSGKQGCPEVVSDSLAAQVLKFSKRFEVRVICHFIDDFAEAQERFQGLPVSLRFAGSGPELLREISGCDRVISSRLHGAIGAISSGVPALLVYGSSGVHRARLQGAAAHFPDLPQCEAEELGACVETVLDSGRAFSENLPGWREDILQSYLRLLEQGGFPDGPWVSDSADSAFAG